MCDHKQSGGNNPKKPSQGNIYDKDFPSLCTPVPASTILATADKDPRTSDKASDKDKKVNPWGRSQNLDEKQSELQKILAESKKTRQQIAVAEAELKKVLAEQKASKQLREEKAELERLMEMLEAAKRGEEVVKEKNNDEVSSVVSTPVSQSTTPKTPTPTTRGSDEGPWTKVGKDDKAVKPTSPSKSQRRRWRKKASSPASQERKQKEQPRKGAPAKGGFGRREQKLPTAVELARMIANNAREEKKVDGVGVFRSVGTGVLPCELLSAMKNYKVACPDELAKLLVDALVRDECKGTCVRGFLNTDVARAALEAGCSSEDVRTAISRFAPANWHFLREFLGTGIISPISFYFTKACRDTLKAWSQRDWNEACSYLNDDQMLLLGADGKILTGNMVMELLGSE